MKRTNEIFVMVAEALMGIKDRLLVKRVQSNIHCYY